MVIESSTAAYEGEKIFDTYTFVSPAIWMGIVVLSIIFIVLVPAILCTIEIQTPSQFEKKPLLNPIQ